MPNENVFKIEVGSVVRLKTGGPEMTVVEIEKDIIVSLYFDEDNELFEMELPVACLVIKVYII